MGIKGKYSIKELENLSGIKAHTIRIWEKRFSIFKPQRTLTNIRFYSNDDLRHLLNISVLHKNGVKISAITAMTQEDIVKQLSVFNNHKNDYSGFQDSLLLCMIEMNETRFNKTFLSIVISMGFENAITKVVFPFFERIGIMWSIGSINPAQEHFISNIIRQKIITATEMLNMVPTESAKTFLLFLPEHEMHELALLFYNYALRTRGYNTIYLGQSVPESDLERITDICHPDAIVTGATTSISLADFQSFIEKLSDVFGKKKIYYTGPMSRLKQAKMPKNACTLQDLIAFLEMDE